jgi:hypothetical protein
MKHAVRSADGSSGGFKYMSMFCVQASIEFWGSFPSLATNVTSGRRCVVILADQSETLYSPAVTVCTARFNIQQCYVLPTQCIYVFCADLRTNSDYFPIQH